MSDYPDADEEFELLYEDDLELLREQNYEDEEVNVLPAPKARKSLDFGAETPKSPEKSLESSQQPVVSKKRTIEDLFGDVGDIFEEDFDDVSSAPKRSKSEAQAQEDLDLIDLIVRKRQEYKINNSITPAGTLRLTNRLTSKERNKLNLSYTVPKYPFIKIKSFDGKSVYVRCHSEEFEREETQRVVKENTFRGLLGDGFKKTWCEAQSLLNKEERVDCGPASDAVHCLNQEKQLWVDLYKPRKYLELLSDESTNRTMLKWMKLWDKVVFHRRQKIKASASESDPKTRFKFNELSMKLDEHDRPEKKVVLLCGPPGLGKTTLAHMVARHAGYNVVEINASDDRSIDAFRKALETATQMRSVMDQERRPNCVVFDEIDGAPPSSIDFLVKFIQGQAHQKKKKAAGEQGGLLKRPVICICNDVYVPALRPLRQIAFVINFPQTTTTRLAERLMEICRRQGIKTDTGAMMALAEKSDNDVRSCLSVLHMYKAQNKSIGLGDVYKASIGQKDLQKGLFAVWNDIFEFKRSKSRSERTEIVLKAIASFGDHERVAQGVYENFPRAHSKNSTLEQTASALDWFCFNDVVGRQIYATQNYSLTGYLNYAFVVWHFAFASCQKQKLIYPTAGYEFKTKQTRQKAIMAEVLRGLAPLCRSYNATLPLLLDVFPLVMRIIAPPFRPVSFHLYTEEERQCLLWVAGVMADYNLNYVQERTPDGTYQFNLDPNVEDLVLFGNADHKKRTLSYSNRQLIAREVEMEKMRRFEARSHRNCVAVVQVAKGTEDKATLPNHLQTLKSKTVKTSPPGRKVIRKDFFGRTVENVASTSSGLVQLEVQGHMQPPLLR